MSALSVAIVRARFNPFGGAERYTQRAFAALGAAGVEVTVIARRWPAKTIEGLPAARAMLRVDPFYLGSLWRDWSFARGVRRVLRQARFDLVQSHERVAGVSIYRAGDGVHASFLEQRRRVLPRWRALLTRLDPHHGWVLLEERRMFTHPALRAVICNSLAVLEDIHQRFGVPRARLHLLRNGLDLTRFAPPSAPQREQARAGFDLAPGMPVFAFVGSGFERKGLSAAMSALAIAGHEAVLLVAGTDRRLRRYRILAHTLGVSSRVRFLGGVEDIRPVLWAADAFLAPALYDPFPNAALEALACGLPVIASPTCGVSELIESGENGFVHDALDVPAIAASMRRLIDVRSDVRFRRAARESALPWTLESAAQSLLMLYRQVLAETPSP